MKTLKLLSATALSILLLAGCEQNNKSVFGTDTGDAIISMYQGETTQIQKGDKLVPDNANTRVKVEHILDHDTKYVTILEGSATLLRGSYALQ